jgi:putative membrane protein
MRRFVIRMLIIAAGIGVAAYLIPGVRVDGTGSLLLAAFMLGFVNAFVRPLIIVLTLPITVITLGLFLVVINAAMWLLVARFLPGFDVAGLQPAFWGWLVSVFVSWVASGLIEPDRR